MSDPDLIRGLLKKCPFCGGNPLPQKELVDGRKDGDLDAWQYWVRCHACAAQGGWAKSSTGSGRNWNMREGKFDDR